MVFSIETIGTIFDMISTEMEKEQVWVCQIFIAGHTHECSPCESVDICQHMLSPNYFLPKFSCNNTSFCFDKSKFRGVSKETISALKRNIIDAGRNVNVKLVLSRSRTTTRGNILCLMSFSCAAGATCKSKNDKKFNDDCYQQVGAKIGAMRAPKSELRVKKSHNPKSPSYNHHTHENRRSYT